MQSAAHRTASGDEMTAAFAAEGNKFRSVSAAFARAESKFIRSTFRHPEFVELSCTGIDPLSNVVALKNVRRGIPQTSP